MKHKIIVKNAVKRKLGYLYSIDSEGNLIEEKNLLDQDSNLEELNVEKLGPGQQNLMLKTPGPIEIKRRLSKLQRRILSYLLNVENCACKQLRKKSLDKWERNRQKLNVEKGPRTSQMIMEMYGSKQIEACRHGGYVEYKKDYLALRSSVYRSILSLRLKGLIEINRSSYYSNWRKRIKLSSKGKKSSTKTTSTIRI